MQWIVSQCFLHRVAIADQVLSAAAQQNFHRCGVVRSNNRVVMVFRDHPVELLAIGVTANQHQIVVGKVLVVADPRRALQCECAEFYSHPQRAGFNSEVLQGRHLR